MSRTKVGNTLDRQIGARIRAIRLQRRFSQSKIGEHLGVTFQQIQKYENGKNRLSGSRLIAMCEVLKCKPTDVLGNGTGVYTDDPDMLTALQDRHVTKMLLAANALPASKRRAVSRAFVLLVQTFLRKF